MYDVSYWEQIDGQIDDWEMLVLAHVGFKTGPDAVFVEVGGFDCRQWSPCYPLAKYYGWTGVFFEPQPDLAAKCLQHHGPNVTVVQKAISNRGGTATLFLGGSISTIIAEERDLYLSLPELSWTGHKEGRSIEVEVAPLHDELERLGIAPGFDVLVIDVEGAETDVLSTFDISYWRPALVAVEVRERFRDKRLAAQAPFVNAYMQEGGYSVVYSDHINNVYAKNGR